VQNSFEAVVWRIVRQRLVPLMLLIGLLQLMVGSALHERGVVEALAFAYWVIPVLAGYEARPRGGTYKDAVYTAWLGGAVNGVVIVAVGLIALATGVLPLTAPPQQGIAGQASMWGGYAIGVAVMMPIMIGVQTIWSIPLGLVGGWLAVDAE